MIPAALTICLFQEPLATGSGYEHYLVSGGFKVKLEGAAGARA